MIDNLVFIYSVHPIHVAGDLLAFKDLDTILCLELRINRGVVSLACG